MRNIVISLGGSVISQESRLDLDFVRRFTKLIKSESKSGNFIITCGGGYTSKQYVSAAGEFTNSNYLKDKIGIAATKANALLVYAAFGLDNVGFANTIDEAADLIKDNRIVVMGGVMPGVTTDAVATLAAEAANSKLLINISRIGGVYEEGNRNKVIKSMGYDKLLALANKHDPRTARANFIFDLVACKIAKRGSIKLHFVGTETEDIKKAVHDTSHSGTIVS
jgi:uridylate kinase